MYERGLSMFSTETTYWEQIDVSVPYPPSVGTETQASYMQDENLPLSYTLCKCFRNPFSIVDFTLQYRIKMIQNSPFYLLKVSSVLI